MSRSSAAKRLDKKPLRPCGVAGLIVVLMVCLVGIVVSGLSTWDHVRFRASGSTQAGVCASLVGSGCLAAHASEYAEILGVPISHYGTGFYLAGAALAVVPLVLRRTRRNRAQAVIEGVAPVLTLMGLGAVAYSVFLASLLLRYKEACPFCIVLYGVNVSVLAVGAAWWSRGQRRVSLRALLVPGVVAAGIGGVFFAATAPFLLQALSETETPTATSAAHPKDKMRPPFALPGRIPSKGVPAAEDDLVEFSDFECPHCAVLQHTIASIFEERGPAGLRVRFVNYPLDSSCNPHVGRSLHPTACMMARAGICAQEQGRFWEFLDVAFALEGERSRAVTLGLARQLGMDERRFSSCLDDDATARTLSDDIALAHRAGVRATPTLLVNGLTFEGALPQARLQKVLDDTTPCGCDRRSPDGTCVGEGRTEP